MRRIGELLVGCLVLAACAILGVGAPTGADSSPCAPAWLQDDAGSGGDAGNVRESATILPGEGRFSGALVPGAFETSDHVDWYGLPVVGAGQTAMVSAELQYPTDARGVALYPAYLQLEVWAPGASMSTMEGSPIGLAGAGATFMATVPGTWHVRLSLLTLEATAPCAVPAEFGGSAVEEGLPLYALYFGCNPHCDAA